MRSPWQGLSVQIRQLGEYEAREIFDLISQDWVCFDRQFRAEALKILHDRSTMPDTKTSGAILHAEYDASCNYDELLLFVHDHWLSRVSSHVQIRVCPCVRLVSGLSGNTRFG